MSSVTSPASSRTASPGPQVRTRANRVALRQYYGLKESGNADSAPIQSPSLQSEDGNSLATSEIDQDSFDPEAYVRKILNSKSLEEMLKIENRLLSEIRNLDGEKKALVYDNYSKLIAATDTIRKMRDNMAPLTPGDNALNEDVSRITTLAENLATVSSSQSKVFGPGGSAQELLEKQRVKFAQVDTVKWVLNAPPRLKNLVESGKQAEAEKDWKEVQSLLDAWGEVRGVDQIRNECGKIMQHP